MYLRAVVILLSVLPCAISQEEGLPFEISYLWNGQPIASDEPTTKLLLKNHPDTEDIVLEITAPFYNDPPPPGKPYEAFLGLWDYEVVEAFFLNDQEQYLEVEVGPHGHHLILLLNGERNSIRHSLPMEVQTNITGNQWHATATIPKIYFPPKVTKFNAYAINGEGDSRRYLSLYPTDGSTANPDFHNLKFFRPINVGHFASHLHSEVLSSLWKAAIDGIFLYNLTHQWDSSPSIVPAITTTLQGFQGEFEINYTIPDVHPTLKFNRIQYSFENLDKEALRIILHRDNNQIQFVVNGQVIPKERKDVLQDYNVVATPHLVVGSAMINPLAFPPNVKLLNIYAVFGTEQEKLIMLRPLTAEKAMSIKDPLPNSFEHFTIIDFDGLLEVESNSHSPIWTDILSTRRSMFDATEEEPTENLKAAGEDKTAEATPAEEQTFVQDEIMPMDESKTIIKGKDEMDSVDDNPTTEYPMETTTVDTIIVTTLVDESLYQEETEGKEMTESQQETEVTKEEIVETTEDQQNIAPATEEDIIVNKSRPNDKLAEIEEMVIEPTTPTSQTIEEEVAPEITQDKGAVVEVEDSPSSIIDTESIAAPETPVDADENTESVSLPEPESQSETIEISQIHEGEEHTEEVPLPINNEPESTITSKTPETLPISETSKTANEEYETEVLQPSLIEPKIVLPLEEEQVPATFGESIPVPEGFMPFVDDKVVINPFDQPLLSLISHERPRESAQRGIAESPTDKNIIPINVEILLKDPEQYDNYPQPPINEYPQEYPDSVGIPPQTFNDPIFGIPPAINVPPIVDYPDVVDEPQIVYEETEVDFSEDDADDLETALDKVLDLITQNSTEDEINDAINTLADLSGYNVTNKTIEGEVSSTTPAAVEEDPFIHGLLPPPHPICFTPGLVPDTFRCQVFYECVMENGQWQVYNWRCKRGYYYDPIKVACIKGYC